MTIYKKKKKKKKKKRKIKIVYFVSQSFINFFFIFLLFNKNHKLKI